MYSHCKDEFSFFDSVTNNIHNVDAVSGNNKRIMNIISFFDYCFQTIQSL